MGATNKLYFRKMEIYHSKNNEIAVNLTTHHYLIKDSRVISLDKSASIKIILY